MPATKTLPRRRVPVRSYPLAIHRSLDTEATGLEVNHGCRPFMVTACTPLGNSRVWEWRVDPITRKPHIPPQEKREIAAYYKGKVIVFHNAKFDLQMLSSVGFEIYFEDDGWLVKVHPKFKGKVVRIVAKSYEDTQLEAHACSSGDDYQRLKSLGVRHLRYPDDDEKELKKAVGVATRFCKSRGVEVSLGYGFSVEKSTGKPKRETERDYWLPRFVYDWIRKNEGKVPPELRYLKTVCATYGRKDAERTILLHLFYDELMDQLKIRNQYEKERQLLQAMYKIELRGITIHKKKAVKKLSQMERSLERYAGAAEKWGSKKLGRQINLASPKDMKELLYEKLKLPVQKKPSKTKDGERKEVITTDKKALEKLIEQTSNRKSPDRNKSAADFLKNLVIGRAYQTGINYLKGYLRRALPFTASAAIALLYPSLNQSGTGTTRLSSNNPNGQNVSKIVTISGTDGKPILVAGEELEGPRLRDLFVPEPGWAWYATDYNQLELRIFAFVSGEENLIKALAEGHDFHGYVASRLFNKPIDKITKQERRIAKNTNFAIIFGGSPWKVDITAGISGAYDMFAGQFPNVAEYMREMIGRARKDRFVYTVDGYRLDIPVKEPYKIVSYLVQGTAGRIIKNAMLKIDREQLVDWINSRIVLQIHDELINAFRIQSGNSHEHASRLFAINKAMEEAGKEMGIYTPTSCEKLYPDWGHGQEIEVTPSRIKPVKKAA